MAYYCNSVVGFMLLTWCFNVGLDQTIDLKLGSYTVATSQLYRGYK